MNDTVIETKENKQVIVQWILTALLGAVVILAGLYAESYIQGIAADTYESRGLKPSELKAQLATMEEKLANVEGDVAEVREDFRTLINKL